VYDLQSKTRRPAINAIFQHRKATLAANESALIRINLH
jgi:hypothetical protein